MCIQRNFCYTGLALLGIDDDNAVGCAATVDGCRGGILQNLDVINVVRRQIVDIMLPLSDVVPRTRIVGDAPG